MFIGVYIWKLNTFRIPVLALLLANGVILK